MVIRWLNDKKDGKYIQVSDVDDLHMYANAT